MITHFNIQSCRNHTTGQQESHMDIMRKLILRMGAVLLLFGVTACSLAGSEPKEFFITQYSLDSGLWDAGYVKPVIFFSPRYNRVSFDFDEAIDKESAAEGISLKVTGYPAFQPEENGREVTVSFELSRDKKKLTLLLPEGELSEDGNVEEYYLSFPSLMFESGKNVKGPVSGGWLLRSYEISDQQRQYLKGTSNLKRFFNPGQIDPDSPVRMNFYFSRPLNDFSQESITLSRPHYDRIEGITASRVNEKQLSLSMERGVITTNWQYSLNLNLESDDGQILEQKISLEGPRYDAYSLNRKSIFQTAVMTASSTLASSSDEDYAAANLIDNSYSSWVEGEEGDGVGTTLTLTMDEDLFMKGIFIRNGFGDLKNFYNNNRVSSMRVSDEEGNQSNIKLADSYRSLYYSFETPLCGKTFTFQITGVYQGDKWNDTCLTSLTPEFVDGFNYDSYLYPPYLKASFPDGFADLVLTPEPEVSAQEVSMEDLSEEEYIEMMSRLEAEEDGPIIRRSDFEMTLQPFHTGTAQPMDTLGIYLLRDGRVLVVNSSADPEAQDRGDLAFSLQGKYVPVSDYVDLPLCEGEEFLIYSQDRDAETLTISAVVKDPDNPFSVIEKKSTSYEWNGSRFE